MNINDDIERNVISDTDFVRKIHMYLHVHTSDATSEKRKKNYRYLFHENVKHVLSVSFVSNFKSSRDKIGISISLVIRIPDSSHSICLFLRTVVPLQ